MYYLGVCDERSQLDFACGGRPDWVHLWGGCVCVRVRVRVRVRV